MNPSTIEKIHAISPASQWFDTAIQVSGLKSWLPNWILHHHLCSQRPPYVFLHRESDITAYIGLSKMNYAIEVIDTFHNFIIHQSDMFNVSPNFQSTQEDSIQLQIKMVSHSTLKRLHHLYAPWRCTNDTKSLAILSSLSLNSSEWKQLFCHRPLLTYKSKEGFKCIVQFRTVEEAAEVFDDVMHFMFRVHWRHKDKDLFFVTSCQFIDDDHFNTKFTSPSTKKFTDQTFYEFIQLSPCASARTITSNIANSSYIPNIPNISNISNECAYQDVISRSHQEQLIQNVVNWLYN